MPPNEQIVIKREITAPTNVLTIVCLIVIIFMNIALPSGIAFLAFVIPLSYNFKILAVILLVCFGLAIRICMRLPLKTTVSGNILTTKNLFGSKVIDLQDVTKLNVVATIVGRIPLMGIRFSDSSSKSLVIVLGQVSKEGRDKMYDVLSEVINRPSIASKPAVIKLWNQWYAYKNPKPKSKFWSF